MKTNEVGHLNLRIPRKQHKALQQIALQENISVSQLVRKYIEKGMELDGYQTQMDLIRSQIREEIASQLQPRMERMIQISYKGSLYSIETAYLCAKALEGLVPPSKQMYFDESMERAIKSAVRVMENQGIRRDRGFLEDLWTEQILEDE